MAGGRPSDYRAEIGDEICMLMSEGMSVLKISELESMPSYRTIMRWRNAHEEFRHNYARAREARADFLAEEALQIIDDKSQDILEYKEGMDVRMLTNSAAVQRAKLQFEGRKWAASQMAPKNWGQQQTQVTGADGGPLQIKLVIEQKKQSE